MAPEVGSRDVRATKMRGVQTKLLRGVNIVQILTSTWDVLHFRWKYSNSHVSSSNENQDYMTVSLYTLEQL
jgi:hypothetical protein